MTKIEQHANLLREAALDLIQTVKQKDWRNTKGVLANIAKHRSIIAAIIEAVEEMQPLPTVTLPPPKRRYPNGHKRSGDLSRFIIGQIKHLQPGEVATVRPDGEFTEHRIRSASASVAGRMWGLGNYITAWVPGEGVEVMRVK